MADELDESGKLISGPFVGQKPEDALQQVIGIATAKDQENQRLREAAAQTQEPPPEPPKKRELDVEKVRGEDLDAANKELADFTEGAVSDLLDKRLGEERDKTFPQDRQRAMETAVAAITREGHDWNEGGIGPAIEKAMTEAGGVSKAQQTDHNSWYNLFVVAKGKAAMVANRPGAPYTEPPSPPTRSGQGPSADYYEFPEEARVHREFDEMEVGGKTMKLSAEEWRKVADDINTQAEWDAFVADREQKQKVRR